MFNFVHSCLTNNFIKLGEVYTFVMTFDDYNSTTKQTTSWLCGATKYFVRHSLLNTISSSSSFRFLAADILLAPKLTKKYYPHETSKIGYLTASNSRKLVAGKCQATTTRDYYDTI